MFGRPLTFLVGAGALALCVLALAMFLRTGGLVAGTEDDGLAQCRRFADLKNAHDAAAESLLGPAVSVPAGAVAADEAQRIDADTFLRRDTLRVVDVRRDAPGRFLLVTQGSATGEPLSVRSGDAVSRSQRVMTNPALVVEVRDGKIHGLRAQLFVE